MSSPLQSGSVVLDANGAGSIRLGPTVYGVKWRVTRMVSGTNDASAVGLRVYRNVVTVGSLVDNSKRGNASSETDITLVAPDVLIGVYSGGTPGAVASFNVEGEQTR